MSVLHRVSWVLTGRGYENGEIKKEPITPDKKHRKAVGSGCTPKFWCIEEQLFTWFWSELAFLSTTAYKKRPTEFERWEYIHLPTLWYSSPFYRLPEFP